MERKRETGRNRRGFKAEPVPPHYPHLHFQSHCFGISAGAAIMPTISTPSSDSFSDISDPAMESLTEEDDDEQVGKNGGEVDNQGGEDEVGPHSLDNNTKDIETRLERETPEEALLITKQAYEEQVCLILSDSAIGEESSSNWQKDITVDGENMITGNVGKGVQFLPRKTDLQTPGDSSLSSMQTPYRRPRSPGATLDDANKNPAVICNFFASGWCIKGNSCNFLHQKGEFSDTCMRMKGNLAGSSRKGYSHGAGSREETKRMKLSASQEPGDLSNTESSLKSPLVLHRALVRACGVENDGPPNSYDDLNMVKAGPQSGRESYPSINDFLQKVVQEEYRRPFGASPYFDVLKGGKSAGDDSLSRRNVNEGNPLREMPRGNPLKDSPYTLSSHSPRIDLIPEFRYNSGGLSTESSLDGNSSFSYAKKSYDLSYENEKSHFASSDSYTSLTSSLNKGFSNLLQPVGYSPLVHSFALAGSVSSCGSVPSSAGSLDTRNTSLIGGENFVSYAASNPKVSSLYYPVSEAENVAQRNVATDLRDFAGTKSTVHDPWAPSVPFRSSFCNAPAKISSYASQYDPLLNSTDPPKSASVTFRSPERIVHNISTQHMISDPILSGNRTPGYNAHISVNSFPRAHEVLCGKDRLKHGFSGANAAVVPLEEDKHSIPGHAVIDANVNEADPCGNMGRIQDKGRNKESKILKVFRTSLVGFVKELVKPSWREGHLSKDAHKMIVKKVVEKVLDALQPHQIPSTADSVNQYLSASRSKLLKLVEGYVAKYIKSGAF